MGGDAELRLTRGKAAAVTAQGSQVAGSPEVLLRERGVERLSRCDGIARRVEAAVGEGGLRVESSDGEDNSECEERSLDKHGVVDVERAAKSTSIRVPSLDNEMQYGLQTAGRRIPADSGEKGSEEGMDKLPPR